VAVLECLMDPRLILSALAGVVGVAIIFATITTVSHVSKRPQPVVARGGAPA
jgi:hypothetical protein